MTPELPYTDDQLLTQIKGNDMSLAIKYPDDLLTNAIDAQKQSVWSLITNTGIYESHPEICLNLMGLYLTHLINAFRNGGREVLAAKADAINATYAATGGNDEWLKLYNKLLNQYGVSSWQFQGGI